MTAVSNIIIFRVDASLTMGSGHVMRCITLATALKLKGYDCRFICRRHEGNLIDKILALGFVAYGLDTPLREKCELESIDDSISHAKWLGCSYLFDAEQSLQIVLSLDVAMLVVDHYAIDRCWEKLLRKGTPKILVIDDLADRQHDCDFLLDQTFLRKESDYSSLVPSSCVVKVGADYAMLRSEFSELRGTSLKRRKKPTLANILITMGGVDKDNVTGLVLNVLEQCNLPDSVSVTVVLGSRSPNIYAVSSVAKQVKYPVDVLVDVDNMSELMVKADLAIGASGSTTWERCCLGVPSLLLVLANNQWASALSVGNAGAAKLIGTPKDLPDKLPALLIELSVPHALSELSDNASQITDGKGVSRVISAVGF